MYKAKEIMTTPAYSVTGDQTLQEVLDLLADKKVSGVPAVDDQGRVIGIISDTDIIRYAHQISVVPLSNLSGWISPYTDIADLASVRKGFEMLHRTKVEQVMTKKVYTVSEDTSATEVAKMMNRRKINRVPVIGAAKQLVGIITRSDMVQCMAKLK